MQTCTKIKVTKENYTPRDRGKFTTRTNAAGEKTELEIKFVIHVN